MQPEDAEVAAGQAQHDAAHARGADGALHADKQASTRQRAGGSRRAAQSLLLTHHRCRRGPGRVCGAHQGQGRTPPPFRTPTTTADEDQDEFAEHFKRIRPPNVLITTSYKVTGTMYRFISELLEVRPPLGTPRPPPSPHALGCWTMPGAARVVPTAHPPRPALSCPCPHVPTMDAHHHIGPTMLLPRPRRPQVLPCATYYKRQGYPLKKIVEYAKNRDFTDLMVRRVSRNSAC